ncbi:alkaline phosphatase PhoX [Pseudoalteromonas mariniglutinosa]|uniref:alkaline phosphatase PhoX n=1 Tax=Pseudoalteromonas mariniglutinosa TaxID=206042 RepID=UPI00384A6FBA
MISRRQFLISAGTLAFMGLSRSAFGKQSFAQVSEQLSAYGPLLADPHQLLDLPAGFSYRVISQLGDNMDDGFTVPDKADGMGCIALDDQRVALVRNHELKATDLAKAEASLQLHKTPLAYDSTAQGVALPGGTSHIIYNLTTAKKEQEYLSLVGTIRNCSGGITPWGSWLTCEETVQTKADGFSQDHGYIFEVSGNAKGLVKPEPLKAMGRFNHEAAAVDPRTGIVYLTEDKGDSLFYRFIPNEFGKLSRGGKLQAMVIKQQPQFDTRNWVNGAMPLQVNMAVEWLDLDQPESPNDDLRLRGYQQGAALFARGEGIHWGEKELYFCCTNGGQKQLGQVMKYQPSAFEGTHKEGLEPGHIQLFIESSDKSLFNFGDNLTVAPNGHLIVCEDQYTEVVDNHLRGVTPQGEVYNFARLSAQTELAGACFSPDGSTLFVNVYSPTKTLAITGPWQSFKS